MSKMRVPLPEAPASIFLLSFVQAFLFLFLFLSLIYGVTELTFFTLILLAIGLGSRLWSRFSLKHVTCEVTLNPKRMFPEELLKIGIRVSNAKLLPILLRIDLFVPRAVSGSHAAQWISEESGLLWFQQTLFSRQFFPGQRGVFNLGPPRIRGGDLFGFFFRHRELKEPVELIVYPRIARIRTVGFPKREFFGVAGARSPVEDPVFVFGTRDYMPGRPARGIHWKASARHNRLQEKLCEPAEHEKVLLLLDVDGFEAENTGEAFEQCLEVIAAIVLQLMRQGIEIGFATNGFILGGKSPVLPISASKFQVAAVLETLARITVGKNRPLLTEILSKGYTIPWGVSSLYFAHDLSVRNRTAHAFMMNRGTPVRFVLAHRPSSVGKGEGRCETDVSYMMDIRMPEVRK